MKVGLTLGKYAPLHKGHQLVIETALKEVDHLYVMVYDCPEVTSIPMPVRANWVRRLYPQVTVVEAWNCSAETGYTPEIMRMQENYILGHMHDKNITHFFCSEPYGDHVSKALNAINRTVDINRNLVPISGTSIRANPYEARHYLPEIVYKDHIVNVVFLGAPSTGKSTIAEHLARDLETVWMPEYGKEYWEKFQVDRRLTLEQLAELASGHLQREEKLLAQARNYLFTDTNAMTTRIFSHHYHGMALPALEEMARQNRERYELCFLCDTDIPYEDTWDRSGEMNREEMQQQIIADLQQRRIPYHLLSGSIEARKTKVKQILQSFKKFSFPREGFGLASISF